MGEQNGFFWVSFFWGGGGGGGGIFKMVKFSTISVMPQYKSSGNNSHSRHNHYRRNDRHDQRFVQSSVITMLATSKKTGIGKRNDANVCVVRVSVKQCQSYKMIHRKTVLTTKDTRKKRRSRSCGVSAGKLDHTQPSCSFSSDTRSS